MLILDHVNVAHRLEQGVYNLSRVRDNAAKRYKGFGIPWEWMQEGGHISQVSLVPHLLCFDV